MRAHQELRGLLHVRQQVRIPHQVRHTQLREAGLARAQQLAGSAQLQVSPRNLEAVVGLANRLQTFACQRRERRALQQRAGADRGAATNPATQLVQLREAHALGILDDHECGVRDVHTYFDDGRRH
jgi:hypothetical protein